MSRRNGRDKIAYADLQSPNRLKKKSKCNQQPIKIQYKTVHA